MMAPVWKTESASGTRCLGKKSPTKEVAAGLRVASPTPTPMRASSTCQKLRDRPQAMVIRDQKKMPAAMMNLRLLWSASQAMGKAAMA